jgi:outer membrane usher protein FimD/PapC
MLLGWSFSIRALSDSTSYSYSSESYNMYSGDIITFNNTITYLRKRNLSLMVGVTFQFMHQDKERMAITIYYNQGLSSIIQADLHYKINGESYNTSLDIKGSAISVNISYPFKLYDSGKKR